MMNTLLPAWYDLVGILGVAAILAAYALLQLEMLTSDSLRYLLLNGSGALLVLISLFFSFNLASFVIEICWLLISIFGLVRVVLRRRAGGA